MSSSTRASPAGRRSTRSASRRPPSRSTAWSSISACNWSIAPSGRSCSRPKGRPVTRASARSWNCTTRSRPGSARCAWRSAGLVRVASIYSVGLHDMSRCMQDFMRRYPKAKVRLEYLRPNKVYDAVLNAEVDLGIVSYPAASPELQRDSAAIGADGAGLPAQAPPGPATGGHRRAPPGRGFRGLRPRPDHPQGDRPLPAAAVGRRSAW